MKKEKLTIDYPDEQTIKSQIELIISKGVTKPKSFPKYLREMYQQLGFRYLFRDATELIFVVLLAVSVFLFGAFQAIENEMQVSKMYSFIFILSPILYILIATLFLVNVSRKSTFEVEMTCKYHVFQLAAFRMLVFSIVSVLINICLIIFLSMIIHTFKLFEALLISISSLSVFATIYLYVLQKFKSRFASYVMIAGWLMINFIPAVYSLEFYTFVLSQIPIYLYVVVSLGCLFVYLFRLKKFITFRNIEGVL